MADVVIRDAQADDAAGIAALSRQNAATYARMAPELFRIPDDDGLVDYLAGDAEWRADPCNLALVAEVGEEIAGYLEASVQPPMPTARWQGSVDLGETRLFINFVGTSPNHQRQGVATRLVQAAEDWGRANGATVATCDTWIDSPFSMTFWESRMGYQRKNVIFRKRLD
jgi:GNAT superfamily N-acetyltransferase